MAASNFQSPIQPYRIMAFDGGGIHAVTFLPILKQIERYLKSSCGPDNCRLGDNQRFNMLVGTSTGSIVAIALKLGFTSEKIMAMYEEQGPRIFSRRRIWNFLFERYSSEGLRNVLTEQFSPKRNGRRVEELVWRDLEIERGPELIVTLWSITDSRRVFLSTNPSRPGQESFLRDARVADIITACCAAPTYFPPQVIKSPDGTKRIYCDGGITGLNNPAGLAMSLVATDGQRGESPIHVLSFGTGYLKPDYDDATIARWTLAHSVKQTVNALLCSTSEIMHDFLCRIGPQLNLELYLRVDYERDPGSDLDDIRAIKALKTKFFKADSRPLTYSLMQSGQLTKNKVLNRASLRVLCRDALKLRHPCETVENPVIGSFEPPTKLLIASELPGTWRRQPMLVIVLILVFVIFTGGYALSWLLNLARGEAVVQRELANKRGEEENAQRKVAERESKRAKTAEYLSQMLTIEQLSLRATTLASVPSEELNAIRIAQRACDTASKLVERYPSSRLHVFGGPILNGVVRAVEAGNRSAVISRASDTVYPSPTCHSYVPDSPVGPIVFLATPWEVQPYILTSGWGQSAIPFNQTRSPIVAVASSASGRVVAQLHASGVIYYNSALAGRQGGMRHPSVLGIPNPSVPNFGIPKDASINDVDQIALQHPEIPRFTGCAVSPHGTCVAAWDGSSTLSLASNFDVPPNSQFVIALDQEMQIQVAAFLPRFDRNQLLVANDGQVSLWDLGPPEAFTPANLGHLTPEYQIKKIGEWRLSERSRSIQIVTSQEAFAVLQASGKTTLFTPSGDASGLESRTLPISGSQHLSMSPDGSRLSVVADSGIVIYASEDVSSSDRVAALHTLKTGDEPLIGAYLLQDGTSILTIGVEGRIRRTGLDLTKVQSTPVSIRAIAPSPHSELVVASDKDGRLYVAKSDDEIELKFVDEGFAGRKGLSPLRFSPNGDLLVGLDSDGALFCFRVAGNSLTPFKAPASLPDRGIRDFVFDRTDQKVFIASSSGLFLWRLDKATAEKLAMPNELSKYGPFRGIVKGPGKRIVAWSINSEGAVISTDGSPATVFECSMRSPISGGAFLNNQRVALVSRLGELRILDANGEAVGDGIDLVDHGDHITYADFHLSTDLDGQRLIAWTSTSEPNFNPVILDAHGLVIGNLNRAEGDRCPVFLQFMDRRTLLTVNGDGRAFTLSIDTGEGFAIPGNPRGARSAALSADRTRYFITAQDGSTVAFPVSAEERADLLQERRKQLEKLNREVIPGAIR